MAQQRSTVGSGAIDDSGVPQLQPPSRSSSGVMGWEPNVPPPPNSTDLPSLSVDRDVSDNYLVHRQTFSLRGAPSTANQKPLRLGIRRLFQTLETEGRGWVAVSKILELYRRACPHHSATVIIEMERLIANMDIDGDSLISYHEFSAFFRCLNDAVFRALDTDASGYLESTELMSVSKRFRLVWTPAKHQHFILSLDRDGDGRISKDEFFNFVIVECLRGDRDQNIVYERMFAFYRLAIDYDVIASDVKWAAANLINKEDKTGNSYSPTSDKAQSPVASSHKESMKRLTASPPLGYSPLEKYRGLSSDQSPSTSLSTKIPPKSSSLSPSVSVLERSLVTEKQLCDNLVNENHRLQGEISILTQRFQELSDVRRRLIAEEAQSNRLKQDLTEATAAKLQAREDRDELKRELDRSVAAAKHALEYISKLESDLKNAHTDRNHNRSIVLPSLGVSAPVTLSTPATDLFDYSYIKATIDEDKKNLEIANTNLSNMKLKNEQLEKDLSNLEEQRRKHASELSKVASKLQVTEVELGVTKDQVIFLQNELQNSDKQNDYDRKVLTNTLSESVKDLESQRQQWKERAFVAEKQVGTLSSLLDERRSHRDVEDAMTCVKDLNARLDASVRDRDILLDQVRVMSEECRRMENDWRNDREFNAMKCCNTIDHMKIELSALARRLDTWKMELQTAKSDVAFLRSSCTDRDKVTNLQSIQLQQIETQVFHILGRTDFLTAELRRERILQEKTLKEMHSLRNTVDALSNERQTLVGERDALKAVTELHEEMLKVAESRSSKVYEIMKHLERDSSRAISECHSISEKMRNRVMSLVSRLKRQTVFLKMVESSPSAVGGKDWLELSSREDCNVDISPLETTSPAETDVGELLAGIDETLEVVDLRIRKVFLSIEANRVQGLKGLVNDICRIPFLALVAVDDASYGIDNGTYPRDFIPLRINLLVSQSSGAVADADTSAALLQAIHSQLDDMINATVMSVVEADDDRHEGGASLSPNRIVIDSRWDHVRALTALQLKINHLRSMNFKDVETKHMQQLLTKAMTRESDALLKINNLEVAAATERQRMKETGAMEKEIAFTKDKLKQLELFIKESQSSRDALLSQLRQNENKVTDERNDLAITHQLWRDAHEARIYDLEDELKRRQELHEKDVTRYELRLETTSGDMLQLQNQIRDLELKYALKANDCTYSMLPVLNEKEKKLHQALADRDVIVNEFQELKDHAKELTGNLESTSQKLLILQATESTLSTLRESSGTKIRDMEGELSRLFEAMKDSTPAASTSADSVCVFKEIPGCRGSNGVTCSCFGFENHPSVIGRCRICVHNIDNHTSVSPNMRKDAEEHDLQIFKIEVEDLSLLRNRMITNDENIRRDIGVTQSTESPINDYPAVSNMNDPANRFIVKWKDVFLAIRKEMVEMSGSRSDLRYLLLDDRRDLLVNMPWRDVLRRWTNHITPLSSDGPNSRGACIKRISSRRGSFSRRNSDVSTVDDGHINTQLYSALESLMSMETTTVSQRSLSPTAISRHSSGNFEINRAIEAQCFHLAASMGDVLTVRRILLDYEDEDVLSNSLRFIDTVANCGLTALHLAAMGAHRHVIIALLAAGANKSSTGSVGRCPIQVCVDEPCRRLLDGLVEDLHTAVELNNIIIAKALISLGDSPNEIRQIDQCTPLHIAAKLNIKELVLILLEAGAYTGMADIRGNLPQDLAKTQLLKHCLISAASASSPKPLQRRRSIILDGNADKKGLHDAAETGDTGRIIHLISTGADINMQLGEDANADNDPMISPLYLAALCGHLEACKVLIENGADPFVCDSYGKNAMHAAAFCGSVDIVSYFAFECDPTLVCSADNDGSTPLHLAAYSRSAGCLQVLLMAGAEIDLVNSEGSTPILLAALSGSYECMRVLIGAGADCTVHDSETEFTPLHYACTAAFDGDASLISELLDRGAEIDCVDKNNLTPLHVSVVSHRVDAVRVLVDLGAETSIVTDKGWSLLHVAAYYGNESICRILCDTGADLFMYDPYGCRPIDLASTYEVRKLLEELEASFLQTYSVSQLSSSHQSQELVVPDGEKNSLPSRRRRSVILCTPTFPSMPNSGTYGNVLPRDDEVITNLNMVASLKSELQISTARISELEALLEKEASRTSELKSSMQSESNKTNNMILSLRSDLNLSTAHVCELELEITKGEKLRTSLKSELQASASRISELEALLEHLETILEKFQQETSKKSERDSYVQSELLCEVAANREALSASNERLNSTRHTVDDTKELFGSMNAELSVLNESRSQNRDRLNILELYAAEEFSLLRTLYEQTEEVWRQRLSKETKIAQSSLEAEAISQLKSNNEIVKDTLAMSEALRLQLANLQYDINVGTYVHCDQVKARIAEAVSVAKNNAQTQLSTNALIQLKGEISAAAVPLHALLNEEISLRQSLESKWRGNVSELFAPITNLQHTVIDFQNQLQLLNDHRGVNKHELHRLNNEMLSELSKGRDEILKLETSWRDRAVRDSKRAVEAAKAEYDRNKDSVIISTVSMELIETKNILNHANTTIDSLQQKLKQLETNYEMLQQLMNEERSQFQLTLAKQEASLKESSHRDKVNAVAAAMEHVEKTLIQMQNLANQLTIAENTARDTSSEVLVLRQQLEEQCLDSKAADVLCLKKRIDSISLTVEEFQKRIDILMTSIAGMQTGIIDAFTKISSMDNSRNEMRIHFELLTHTILNDIAKMHSIYNENKNDANSNMNSVKLKQLQEEHDSALLKLHIEQIRAKEMTEKLDRSTREAENEKIFLHGTIKELNTREKELLNQLAEATVALSDAEAMLLKASSMMNSVPDPMEGLRDLQNETEAKIIAEIKDLTVQLDMAKERENSLYKQVSDLQRRDEDVSLALMNARKQLANRLSESFSSSGYIDQLTQEHEARLDSHRRARETEVATVTAVAQQMETQLKLELEQSKSDALEKISTMEKQFSKDISTLQVAIRQQESVWRDTQRNEIDAAINKVKEELWRVHNDEIQSMEQKIISLNAVINSLLMKTEDIMDTKPDISSPKTNDNDLDIAQNNIYYDESMLLKEELRVLQLERSRLKDLLSKLETGDVSMLSPESKLARNLHAVEEDNKKSQTFIDYLMSDIENANKTQEDVIRDIDEIRLANLNLISEREEMQVLCESLRAMSNILRQEQADNVQCRRDLQLQVDNLQHVNTEKQILLNGVSEDLRVLKDTYSKLLDEKEILVSRLEQNRNEYDIERRNLIRERDNSLAMIKKLQSDFRYGREGKTLQSGLDEIQPQRDELLRELGTLRMECKVLSTEREALTTRCESLVQELVISNQTIDDFEFRLLNFEEECSKLRAAVGGRDRMIFAFENDISRISDMIETLSTKRRVNESDFAKLTSLSSVTTATCSAVLGSAADSVHDTAIYEMKVAKGIDLCQRSYRQVVDGVAATMEHMELLEASWCLDRKSFVDSVSALHSECDAIGDELHRNFRELECEMKMEQLDLQYHQSEYIEMAKTAHESLSIADDTVSELLTRQQGSVEGLMKLTHHFHSLVHKVDVISNMLTLLQSGISSSRNRIIETNLEKLDVIQFVDLVAEVSHDLDEAESTVHRLNCDVQSANDVSKRLASYVEDMDKDRTEEASHIISCLVDLEQSFSTLIHSVEYYAELNSVLRNDLSLVIKTVSNLCHKNVSFIPVTASQQSVANLNLLSESYIKLSGIIWREYEATEGYAQRLQQRLELIDDTVKSIVNQSDEGLIDLSHATNDTTSADDLRYVIQFLEAERRRLSESVHDAHGRVRAMQHANDDLQEENDKLLTQINVLQVRLNRASEVMKEKVDIVAALGGELQAMFFPPNQAL